MNNKIKTFIGVLAISLIIGCSQTSNENSAEESGPIYLSLIHI